MKKKLISVAIILYFIAFALFANGQIILKAERIVPSNENKVKISKYLKNYKMFTMDMDEL